MPRVTTTELEAASSAVIGVLNDVVLVSWVEKGLTYVRSKQGCRIYDEADLARDNTEIKAMHPVISMAKEDALAFVFDGRVSPAVSKEVRVSLGALVPKLAVSESLKNALAAICGTAHTSKGGPNAAAA